MKNGQEFGYGVILSVVIAILVGTFFGATVFPNTVLLPGEIEYIDVEKVVTQELTDEEIAALVDPKVDARLAEIAEETSTEGDDRADLQLLLDQAVADFEAELEDEDDLRVCDGIEYDDDEFTVKNIEDNFDIDVDDAEDNEYTVTFEAEVKFKDEDTCRINYEVEVEYDDDDVDVTITEI